MTTIHEIVLEPLNPETFAPFGQLIGELNTPAVFSGPHIDSWRMDFGAEGPIELMFSRYRYQPMAFTQLERHFNVTQCFVPLGNQPSVMVVAAPTVQDGRNASPAPSAIRAFYADGSRGILLWKGTWHALTRFPARPSGAEFALITGYATQRELEREKASGIPPRLTEVIDYRERFGVSLKVVDSGGLLPKDRDG